MASCVLAGLACAASMQANAATKTADFYDLNYTFAFEAGSDTVAVSIRLNRNAELMRWMRFRIDPEVHTRFRGDGEITSEGDELLWTPPGDGGELRYRVVIDNRRSNGAFDALHGKNWALFRGDDLVPPARVRTEQGAEARARLKIELPDGWSSETPYARAPDGRYVIQHAERRFDRPIGWMIVGRYGVRRETIAGTQVAVAGPKGQSVRRLDMLAFLNWNLPRLARIAPRMPGRLLIVSAGDPMWRGGLSGPGSIYIHAERPLISENGTSTLMHELVHSVFRLAAAPGDDWIVEGLAEYYSLEIMRRSGTLTDERFERAHRSLKKWGRKASSLNTSRSKGSVTARAVGVFVQLERELRRSGEATLDDVVTGLAELDEPIALADLRRIGAALNGAPLKSLADEKLPGVP